MSTTVGEMRAENVYLKDICDCCLKPDDEEISSQSLQMHALAQHVQYAAYFVSGVPSLIEPKFYGIGLLTGIPTGIIAGYLREKFFDNPGFTQDWYDWSVHSAAKRTWSKIADGAVNTAITGLNIAYTFLGDPFSSAYLNGFFLGCATGYNGTRAAVEKINQQKLRSQYTPIDSAL